MEKIGKLDESLSVTFVYEDKKTIPIDTIAVIGDFNQYDEVHGEMEKEGDSYCCSIELPEGEYHYRFLINGELSLTDPYNNVFDYREEEDELWSFLKIDSLGHRLYKEETDHLQFEAYDLMTTISEHPNHMPTKLFRMGREQQVVARMEFWQITGVHNITTAFYAPNGELFEYSEHGLIQPEEQESVFLWFWLSMEEVKASTGYEGTWFLRVFINGEHILEDTFFIKKELELTPIRNML